jgi:hypothetical protein
MQNTQTKPLSSDPAMDAIMRKHLSSQESARAFLRKIGILTADNQIAPEFLEEPEFSYRWGWRKPVE